MSDKQEIRSLTREEQLIWEISFLENSIKQQKEVLDKIKEYVNKEISLIDKDLSECELTYSEKYNFENAKNKYINILELLEEIE